MMEGLSISSSYGRLAIGLSQEGWAICTERLCRHGADRGRI